MTYQIARDGQLYGPYTVDDLRRYIASGNVLPTDLAKSEEMTSWIPVAQILSSHDAASQPAYVPVEDTHSAPAENGPVPPVNYPPVTAASYAAPTAQYPDPPNLNWGLELLLGFFTCAIFVVVWNLVIAAWAKRVDPNSKAFFFYIAATILIVMNVGGSWGAMMAVAYHHPYHGNIGSGIISLIAWVIRLVARFSLRDTLEQHFNGPEPLGLRLNPVLVFFFGGLYMQYKLNQVNEVKRALRYQNLPR